MRKKITSVALAVIFSLSMAGVSLAAKCKGKVESVESGKVVIGSHHGRRQMRS